MRAAVRTGLLGWTIAFTDKHPAPQDGSGSGARLGPNEVLIRVKSAAINPVDYKLPRLAAGKVVGIDLSGTAEEVGSDVSGISVGDAVFGRAMRSGGLSGSLAEYAIADAEHVAKKPERMSHEEAAALPTAYLTGIQSLRAGGGDKAGSSVLVVGASGGCGLAGAQLALASGASRVVGVCSGKNFDFVRGAAGRDVETLELVDYTDEGAFEKFKGDNAGKFDCIYDTATGSGKGEDYTSTLPALLKEGMGTYIQINGDASAWARKFAGREKPNRKMVITAPGGRADLAEIASLLESSGARPPVNLQSFDDKGVKEGFALLKSRRTRGKIVFNIG